MTLSSSLVRRPGCARPADRHGESRDSGSATLQLIIITPLMLFIIFGSIQYALWSHAKHVLLAAAQTGARAAEAADQTNQQATDAGTTAATDFIAQVGPKLVSGTQLHVTRTNTTVTVTVHADAVNLVPGLPLHIKVKASGLVQRYRP